MGKHRLKKGLRIINALEELGRELGYYVEPESPVSPMENQQAIDVAWFINEGIDYPIMIFEIESRATNGAAANPLKIYGKSNRELEKPLFFFHIFVDSGKDPALIEDLEGTYGRNNYRTYQLNKGELPQLAKDILSQHRRMNVRIPLLQVITRFTHGEWAKINLSDILMHLEDCDFKENEDSFLPTYALLSRSHPIFKNEFLRYLKSRIHSSESLAVPDSYDDYIAYSFGAGIYLGILQCVENDSKFTALLREWQEGDGNFKMIGPKFGLDQDYDHFVTRFSGAYWGLLATLMKEDADATNYILEQISTILDALNPECSESFYLTLWGLHIAASSNGAEVAFQVLRDYANASGVISEYWLSEPPATLGDVDATCMDDSLNSKHIYIPDVETFREQYCYSGIKDWDQCKSEAIDVAIEMLVNPNVWFEWEERLKGGDSSRRWGYKLLNCLNFRIEK